VADLEIRVQPRAKRTEVAGERGGVVLIRVAAPPLDGRANDAVCRLIAKRLGVPARSVRIVRGESARDKVVHVDGMSGDDVRAVLLG
jgi:uncharacterized protein